VPNWVWSRRRAVFAAASFSKVTLADFGASASPDEGVMVSVVILPQAEEVADFLLGGGRRDARDVDGGVARHGVEVGW